VILKKIRNAARIVRQVNNFIDVYAHLLLGKELLNLQLRNGIQISSRNDIDLWRHYHDIWLIEIYTRDYNPIKSNSIILDIGASIGIFSLFAAHLGGRVFSFEPDPESFRYLTNNARKNSRLQINPFPFAISSCRSNRNLFIRTERTGSSFYQRSEGTGSGMIDVECKALEDVLTENNIEKCDFLKMNCEGAEYEILLNTTNETLSHFKYLVIECHEKLTTYTFSDVVQRLKAGGYQVSTSLKRTDGTRILTARNEGF
jgi:FkbM family methyltransferase